MQKGPAERGHVKKRQKSSKSVKNIFDTFRHFSRRAKNVKNRQKVSKSFSTIFARHLFSGPFCNPLRKIGMTGFVRDGFGCNTSSQMSKQRFSRALRHTLVLFKAQFREPLLEFTIFDLLSRLNCLCFWKYHPNTNHLQTSLIFSGRKFRIILQRQMQI